MGYALCCENDPVFAVPSVLHGSETTMICWSCGKEIPTGAQLCQFCEAAVEPEPTEQELRMVGDMLENMPPEAIQELEAAFAQSKDGQDFVNRIMVGDCPACESSNTGDCDGDPEIDDIGVGRCFDCGQLWCCECRQLLSLKQPHCSACDEEWEEDE
jgi:hypothetical protein